jgi:hypothetical protein
MGGEMIRYVEIVLVVASLFLGFVAGRVTAPRLPVNAESLAFRERVNMVLEAETIKLRRQLTICKDILAERGRSGSIPPDESQ